ncbi:cytochrome P450, partial [Aureobasidium melanogenum]
MAIALSFMPANLLGATSVSHFLIGCLSLLALYLIYRRALPQPLDGIPYHAASARKLFGDVPGMLSHIAQDEGTSITYLVNSIHQLEAPLVQVFIKPFSKPLLILSDFQEAHDIMTRRTKEFDRSTSSGDLVRGLGPKHHIHLKTTPVWRAQRRLVQDLMTPAFLNEVASHAIHQNACVMVELWRVKSRLAAGRPWSASGDIDQVALDAVLSFAFGSSFGEKHSSMRPALAAVKCLSVVESDKSSAELPVQFPSGDVDEVIRATLELVATVEQVQGSPVPNLKWAYVNSLPRIRRATNIKEKYIKHELADAIQRLATSNSEHVKSAVDHMVFRERMLAEKDGRRPEFYSRVMMDEIFGFIVAGNDTSSTTISWGLKYLADNAAAQIRLRKALEQAHNTAKLEHRDPTIHEITRTLIPYLDATIEEILRCAASVPVVNRQATVDTTLLGHFIPKDTVVTCLVTGPSMLSPALPIPDSLRSDISSATKPRAWESSGMAAFNPSRWLVQGDKGEEFDPNAGPQLAFGAGVRQCYGKRLAYLEIKILVSLIIWNFELLECPAALSGDKPTLIMTNRPKDCYVTLREVDRTKK